MTSGLGAALLALVPGCLLVSTGTAQLLLSGDHRISHFTAAGGVSSFVPSRAAYSSGLASPG